MKTTISLFSTVIAFIGLTAFQPAELSDGFYRIDTGASKIVWVGSKITGSSHTGTVSITEGGLQLEGGKVAGGKFTIDMTTINVTDLDGSMKSKLEGHLKNDDFFSVEKFKTANLTIKSVNGDNITADLTIKGITNAVTFPAKVVTDANGSITATAKIEVDRSKFDVRYGSDSFFDNLGDKAINNIIEFEVTLKGSK